MMNSDETRQQVVNSGAISALVELLNSPDIDVQYYCTATLTNIATDGEDINHLGKVLISFLGANREKLTQSELKIVQSFIRLIDSPTNKVQCQAALGLRNLAAGGGSNSPPSEYR